MTERFWTKDKTSILTSGWRAGKSAGLLAREFGCSRNAVVGKLKRLDMIGFGRPTLKRLPADAMSEAAKRAWADTDIRAKRVAGARRSWRKRKAAMSTSDRVSEAADENDRLRAALESLTKDPPPTLSREPDTDCEVVLKMRAIARAALSHPNQMEPK